VHDASSGGGEWIEWGVGGIDAIKKDMIVGGRELVVV
jgi:hypothetical protein